MLIGINGFSFGGNLANDSSQDYTIFERNVTSTNLNEEKIYGEKLGNQLVTINSDYNESTKKGKMSPQQIALQ